MSEQSDCGFEGSRIYSYTGLRCRCSVCVSAMREWKRAYRHANPHMERRSGKRAEQKRRWDRKARS